MYTTIIYPAQSSEASKSILANSLAFKQEESSKKNKNKQKKTFLDKNCTHKIKKHLQSLKKKQSKKKKKT